MKRCLENAFEGIAKIDRALNDNCSTGIPHLSENATKWLDAIPGLIP